MEINLLFNPNNFQISEREAYLLEHNDGTTLRLDDISEGERNLLSLIYFYYEMLDDNEILNIRAHEHQHSQI